MLVENLLVRFSNFELLFLELDPLGLLVDAIETY